VRDQYGNCDHDVPQNFNISGAYTFPTLPMVPKLIGRGFQISTVFTALSGRPFSALIGTSDPSGQGLGGGGNVIRASYDGSPLVYDTRNSNHTNPFQYVQETFTAGGQPDPCGDTSGGLPLTPFFIPCAGQVGSSRRNMLRGPGLSQLDLTLIKDTKITERLTVQFRWEVYNVLNRANFAPFVVNNSVTSSSFGTISNTPDVAVGNPVLAQGAPRSMNLALKVIF
jgi:hypothetical protein